MQMTVGEIAERLGGNVVGDRSIAITGVNGIKEAGSGDVAYIADPRYLSLLSQTRASAVIVPPGVSGSTCALIQVPNPYLSFYRLVEEFRPSYAHPVSGVHPTAVVEEGACLGRNVALGAHVFVASSASLGDHVVLYPGVHIGSNCAVGERTVMYPNVVLREGVRVGARCILHPGVVLGSDGFGFVAYQGRQHKVPQLGSVTIGDDVEIGANSCVDRATFGTTTIGSGSKLDNLVQIGHNAQIGEHCVFSGQSGIAGSAILGNHVTIAAKVGVAGHLTVGDGVTVAGFSGVTKSIPPGRVVSGFPAQDHDVEKRIRAGMRFLPAALKRIQDLEQRIARLEGREHGATEDDSE
ncbi:MAG: UDP-3-O-(3-hydroxymyristoyl)glucosamine N-acyltransferase [FCB group bacterium]|jgi:UDP-3-O-[3-hydroxymyristoyl] glucosamine N-acyltransferase|nr:UDP-3-O-(3-hydroxymyristoyl)glucosamine N-acyltransferase [FCB group bacterium]